MIEMVHIRPSARRRAQHDAPMYPLRLGIAPLIDGRTQWTPLSAAAVQTSNDKPHSGYTGASFRSARLTAEHFGDVSEVSPDLAAALPARLAASWTPLGRAEEPYPLLL